MQMGCLALLPLLAGSALLPSLTRVQVLVLEISPAQSTIKFHVSSSIDISGRFDEVGRHPDVYIP